jgi:hypothetical protein
MIREIASSKNTPEPAFRNSAVSKSTAKTAKSSASAAPAVQRSAASLAASAGLPADKLSSSIVLFARFFSLPLKPRLLADIRRQAFLPAQQSPAQQGVHTNSVISKPYQNTGGNSPVSLDALKSFVNAKGREALSLAAAAAESKGVELQPKGLESYAEAVDPDRQQKHDGERRRRNRSKNEQAEKASLKTGSVTAESLKKMAFECMEKDPLLDILNRLPGKNGQRWIVLPFDFIKDGKEFKVSMRILLNDGNLSGCAAYMALDIRMRDAEQEIKSEKDTINADQKWLFVMEAAGNQIMKLSLYLMSEFQKRAQSQLKKELSQLLEIPFERISIKSSTEAFPHEVSWNESFSQVDEAV